MARLTAYHLSPQFDAERERHMDEILANPERYTTVEVAIAECWRRQYPKEEKQRAD